MGKIELSITSDYCRSWGVWEGVRELISNAKDADEFDGHEMCIEHMPRTNLLRIISKHVTVPAASLLLLGKSVKSSAARGRFGEGFLVGVLALVRLGVEITIYNGDQVWRPELRESDTFPGEKILTFSTRQLTNVRRDFTIEITPIPKNAWEIIQQKFLFLKPPKAGQTIEVAGGKILLEEVHKGNVFCKDIWICHYNDLECGYTIDQLELDRDRRAVREWELHYTLSGLWEDACVRHPEQTSKRLYAMLSQGTQEARSFRNKTLRLDVVIKLREHFEGAHGAEAVPVITMHEHKEIQKLGGKPALVDPRLADVLRQLKPLEDTKKNLRSMITSRFVPEDLVLEELDGWALTNALVDACHLSLVEFADKEPRCLFLKDENLLAVSRQALQQTPYETLRLVAEAEGDRMGWASAQVMARALLKALSPEIQESGVSPTPEDGEACPN